MPRDHIHAIMKIKVLLQTRVSVFLYTINTKQAVTMKQAITTYM